MWNTKRKPRRQRGSHRTDAKTCVSVCVCDLSGGSQASVHAMRDAVLRAEPHFSRAFIASLSAASNALSPSGPFLSLSAPCTHTHTHTFFTINRMF